MGKSLQGLPHQLMLLRKFSCCAIDLIGRDHCRFRSWFLQLPLLSCVVIQEISRNFLRVLFETYSVIRSRHHLPATAFVGRAGWFYSARSAATRAAVWASWPIGGGSMWWSHEHDVVWWSSEMRAPWAQIQHGLPTLSGPEMQATCAKSDVERKKFILWIPLRFFRRSRRQRPYIVWRGFVIKSWPNLVELSQEWPAKISQQADWESLICSRISIKTAIYVDSM